MKKDANEDARYIYNCVLSSVIQNNFAVHRMDIFLRMDKLHYYDQIMINHCMKSNEIGFRNYSIFKYL